MKPNDENPPDSWWLRYEDEDEEEEHEEDEDRTNTER